MNTPNELPAVARSIYLDCKKCGTDRYFRVLAHTGADSAKVKCEVCGAQKTYKVPKPKAAAKRVSVKAKAAAKAKQDGVEAWNQLREKMGGEDALPYNMRSKFAVGVAIQHPKFGLGFVKVVTGEKIDVAFEEGDRSLVHNRA